MELALHDRTPRRRRAARPLLSVCGGLILFWLLLGAVERKIPVISGFFAADRGSLPIAVKLLLLAICLSVGLWTGMTVRGQALYRRLDAAGRRNSALWLISLCVTALFLLWASRVTVFSFMTSDEKGILQQIGRTAVQGHTQAGDGYSNPLLCVALAFLYRLFPGGYWYTWYHLLILSISLLVVGRCILLKTREHGWPLAAGVLIHLLMCGIFFYTFSVLSFTVTPAAAGCAAVALTLCRGELRSPGARAASDAGAVVLMLLCYLQRILTGRPLLCYFGLAAVYAAVELLRRRDPGWFRQLIAFAVSLLVLAGGVRGLYAAADSEYFEPDLENAYSEYLRARVTDFIVTDMTDEELAEADIPPELATLLRGWYFMDERINADILSDIVDLYSAKQYTSVTTVPRSDLLMSLLRETIGAIRNDPNALSRVVCLLSLLAVCAAAVVRFGKRSWVELLFAICAMGGAALMCLYLVNNGRYPTRVFLVVLQPAVVFMLLMALTAPADAPPLRKGRRIACLILAAAAGIGFCAGCWTTVRSVPYVFESVDADTVFAGQNGLEAYAKASPDVTFITNIYDGYPNPFHGVHYPDNIRLWGSVSDPYIEEGRLYADAFFRSDVRFLCDPPAYVLFLMQYLTLDHGPVAALQEAHIADSIYVFDMTRVTPGDDYTGWYEWNGLTYYFENGQAVSGEQVIDGTVYEFVPAGKSAGMTTVTADEGLYYTTLAYTLRADS